MNKTINGYAIVDTKSKQPLTPLYFVAYGHTDNEYIANKIAGIANTQGLIPELEKYKYTPMYEK